MSLTRPSSVVSSLAATIADMPGVIAFMDASDQTSVYDGLSGENGVADANDPVGVWIGREGHGGRTVADILAGQGNLWTGASTVGANWTDNGDGSYTKAPGTAANISEDVGLELNAYYTVSFDWVRASGQLYIRMGTTTNDVTISSGLSGHYFGILPASGVGDFALRTNSAGEFTVSNIAVSKVLTSVFTPPATGSQPSWLSTGALGLDGVDDGFEITPALTGVEFAMAAVKVASGAADYATLTAYANNNDTNSIRIDLAASNAWRAPGGPADFVNPDGEILVNGASTTSYVADQMHIMEAVSGFTAEKTVGAVGLASVSDRYFKGEIGGLIFTNRVPSAEERTTLRTAIASLYGVTLS